MYNTQVLTPTPEALAKASELLSSGELVAFPTETVYGLGANALNREAVLSIFAAKDRPADNPLIVHIWNTDQLEGLCEIPEKAPELIARFWPGPLTILMSRKQTVPSEVTAGLDTVAIRMPSHPVAQALLKTCALPIAAPSANRSGKPSPTSAGYVYQDMKGRIPLILDGGDCEVGLESTVLDLTHGQPTILRPGGITREALETVLGPVQVAGSVLRPLQQGEIARSPGMRYRHYAPQGEVTLIEGEESAVISEMKKLYADAVSQGLRACVMCFTEHLRDLQACHPHDIGSKEDPAATAHLLFDTLRKLDDEHMDVIYSEVVPPEGIGLAVMNRLGRAASFRTVHAGEAFAAQNSTENVGQSNKP